MLHRLEESLKLIDVVYVLEHEGDLFRRDVLPLELLNRKVVHDRVRVEGLCVSREGKENVVVAMTDQVHDLAVDTEVFLQQNVEEVLHHSLFIRNGCWAYDSTLADEHAEVVQIVLKEGEGCVPLDWIARR